MLSIMDQAPAGTPALEQAALQQAVSAAPELAQREEKAPEASQQEPCEYEIVVGRAQIASWLFVAVIAIAVCSSLAYLAGKSTGAKKAPAPVAGVKPPEAAPATPQQALPQTPPAPLPTASVVVPPKADLQTALTTVKSSQSLFGEPESGKVYIQMG